MECAVKLHRGLSYRAFSSKRKVCSNIKAKVLVVFMRTLFILLLTVTVKLFDSLIKCKPMSEVNFFSRYIVLDKPSDLVQP